MVPPLLGLRVLLTRPLSEAGDRWAAALSDAGAVVVSYPTIEVAPPQSWDALDRALGRLDRYDWLVFVSTPAVRFTASRLPGGCFPRPMLRPRVAAVGRQTAEAARATGADVSLVPADQRAQGLLEAFGALPAGARFLIPESSAGKTLLGDALRTRGCVVDVVPAYQTVPRPELPDEPPPFDVATFASPSALRAFVAHHGNELLFARVVAVIGPTTAEEAAALGVRVVVADTPTVEAMIRAITQNRQQPGEP